MRLMLLIKKRTYNSCDMQINALFYLNLLYTMERWLSGLKRLPAKQESPKGGTRVRIPLSPPVYAYPGLPARQATPGTATF